MAVGAAPGMDIGQVQKQQDQSFQQQLALMQLQQKKSDQDTLINALTSEVKADRDTKSSIGRNLA
jgi:hypothetical protein